MSGTPVEPAAAGAAPFDPVAVGTAIQRRIGVKTSRDEPLARFTTMRVGGPADLFATVHNVHELRAIVRFARSRGIPLTLLGRGSDVVIADAGIRGLVVQNRAEGSQIVGDRYVAESGLPMARAATETQKAGLTGLEFGLAIPGTVGGAVWAAPLLRVPRESFLQARRAALRQVAISNARQIGLSLRMYLQDYDETFPPGDGSVNDAIYPYLKNRDLFNNPATGQAGFSFSLGGEALSSIQNPAETIMGYLTGPGGRAVMYADGHVKWEQNP